jgi:hypothetical protein
MPRKIIIRRPDGSALLAEGAADDEAQLQELVKDNPDLLPIEEFGMTGPLMVIGRETTLPSGAVDLVTAARSGELLIIEFKTGPQNTDFRHALAQLLDYGSDMWRMSFEDFEGTVPARYFSSDRCRDARVRGKNSLLDAARATWSDLGADDAQTFQEQINRQLQAGSFHYVLVAQRFVPTVERTVEYLNAAMNGSRFYAVELVRFAGDGLEAFESRTVLRPNPRAQQAPLVNTSEGAFLDGLHDQAYASALRELFEVCRGLNLRFGWSTLGVSIRVPTPDRAEPLSIGWLFPPGKLGWYGLTDLSLGYDPASAEKTPSVRPALDRYVDRVSKLASAQPAKTPKLRAYGLSPSTFVTIASQVLETLAELVREINEGS